MDSEFCDPDSTCQPNENCSKQNPRKVTIVLKKRPETDSREKEGEATKSTEMEELRAEGEATKATELKELVVEDSVVGTQQDLKDDKETKDEEECWAPNGDVEKKETPDKTEKEFAPPPYELNDQRHLMSAKSYKPDKFFIRSQMNTNRVLEVENGEMLGETDVCSCKMRTGFQDCQLWYFDDDGVIRSALHGMALDVKKYTIFGLEKIVVRPYTREPRQKWRLHGRTIMNDEFNCIDIKGESNWNGATVIPYKYKESANQHWDIQTTGLVVDFDYNR